MRYLTQFVPILSWLPQYKASDFRGDITAGLTVAVMIIPQAIAYGLLAGVTPEVALYASIVPMIAYSIFGTCRELSVGPAALISLMTAEAIGEVAPEATAGGELWLSLAILLAVMVGAMQLGLGLARLGVLVNFLSRPVVNGFMSAAALIIAASQLGLALGYTVPSGHFFPVIYSAAAGIQGAHLATVGLALGCIGLLVLARVAVPRVPAAFLLVAGTTAVTWMWGLDAHGLAIVGEVSGGVPLPSIPTIPSWQLVIDLLPYALTIGLVGFLESISVAKTYGFQHRYDVSANQELAAVGIANLAGGLFGGFVTTGNISRTVVAVQAGARTQIAALVTALVVLITVIALAPLFTYLPKATLAAIIIVAVAGIVDFKEPLRLLRIKRADALGLAVTFVATLLVGVEWGILTGVGASLALHLYQTTSPHISLLGRVPGTHHYRCVDRHSEIIVEPDVIVLRIDESLYFANAPRLKDAVEHWHNVHDEVPIGLVLDCVAINDLDATAMTVLEQIADELREAGTRLCLAGVSGPISDVLERGGVLAHVGPENIYLGVHEAVESFRPAIVELCEVRAVTEGATASRHAL